MSIFGKLFNKDEQSQELKLGKPLQTAFGTFRMYYGPTHNPPRVGYNGKIDWYDPEEYSERFHSEYDKVSISLETNTLDTAEADICLERLVSIVDNRYLIEDKIAAAITERFVGDDGFITNDDGVLFSASAFMNELEIVEIELFRNGDTEFYVSHHFNLPSEITEEVCVRAILKFDGVIEVEIN